MGAAPTVDPGLVETLEVADAACNSVERTLGVPLSSAQRIAVATAIAIQLQRAGQQIVQVRHAEGATVPDRLAVLPGTINVAESAQAALARSAAPHGLAWAYVVRTGRDISIMRAEAGTGVEAVRIRDGAEVDHGVSLAGDLLRALAQHCDAVAAD